MVTSPRVIELNVVLILNIFSYLCFRFWFHLCIYRIFNYRFVFRF